MQQSAHGRFSWPLSVFGGVGLAKAMATLLLWSLTFVCLSLKDDKNWASLSHVSVLAEKVAFECSPRLMTNFIFFVKWKTRICHVPY